MVDTPGLWTCSSARLCMRCHARTPLPGTFEATALRRWYDEQALEQYLLEEAHLRAQWEEATPRR